MAIASCDEQHVGRAQVFEQPELDGTTLRLVLMEMDPANESSSRLEGATVHMGRRAKEKVSYRRRWPDGSPVGIARSNMFRHRLDARCCAELSARCRAQMKDGGVQDWLRAACRD